MTHEFTNSAYSGKLVQFLFCQEVTFYIFRGKCKRTYSYSGTSGAYESLDHIESKFYLISI